jgi:hypothetical protein
VHLFLGKQCHVPQVTYLNRWQRTAGHHQPAPMNGVGNEFLPAMPKSLCANVPVSTSIRFGNTQIVESSTVCGDSDQ